MWFTWSSGAGRPFGLASSLAPRGSGMLHQRSFSNEAVRYARGILLSQGAFAALFRAVAQERGPRHASTSSGTTCGGKNPVEVAAPWPFTAALLDLDDASPHIGPRGPSTGSHGITCMMMCATLLTLVPTFPTRSGPCDPAAKPGFLSWGCPKIAPPSYRSRNPTPRDVLPCPTVLRPLLRGRASAHRFLRR
jgi:hypothetical protein